MSISQDINASDRTRILIVMNSCENATSIANHLTAATDMEIVGISPGTTAGLAMMREILPDIVLVECGPDLVQFTTEARGISPAVGILLLSQDRSKSGAQQIVDALAAGAFDFVSLLDSGTSASTLLLSKIRCCSIKQYSQMAQIGQSHSTHGPIEESSVRPMGRTHASAHDAILVGVSTGGPEALMELLTKFDPSIPVPIIVVLHMPKEFTGAMAASLDKKCQIQVQEVQDGEEPIAGRAYLAQGGKHCLLDRMNNGRLILRLGDGPAENGCRPAVDVLFRSGAIALGRRALAAVLTGMGSDGTQGARELKRCGSLVLVQDESSSVVWGMPGSVVRAGLADEIVPLARMAARLSEIVGGIR